MPQTEQKRREIQYFREFQGVCCTMGVSALNISLMLYYYGPWVKSAACRNNPDADADVWFDDPVTARKICMKCPVKDECLFTALELIQRGETIKGIWGGLSAIQLHRARANPASIPKMRGQRSRAKEAPTFLVPVIPEDLLSNGERGGSCLDRPFNEPMINLERLMKTQPFESL